MVWIVDAMNVIGSRPTGWWRDRSGAVRRLVDASRRFAASSGERVILVVDGRPAGVPEGEDEGVRVVHAARPGPDAADDVIVELVARESMRAGLHVVVTSDRRLAERVRPLGVQVESAGTWLRALDAASAH